MGIALTSVLTAMNKSRGGSLQDSAMVIANAFNQKYTESLVGGVPSDVYAGTNEPLTTENGYNFQSNAIYYIDKALANTFNISEDNYAFANSDQSKNANYVASVDTNVGFTANTTVKNSFVQFDASTGKFVVCMFANKTGSYYVDNYKLTAAQSITSLKVGTSATNITITGASGEMYACSNGTKSW